MKAIKKIDSCRRIIIPMDIQNELGWNIGDLLELEVIGNGIILKKCENVSKDILTPNRPIENNEVNLVRNERLNIPDINNFFKKQDLDLLDDKDVLNDKLCPKCRKPIEYSRFRFNGNYLCRNCRDKIRDNLSLDISRRFEEVIDNE